MCLLCGTPDPSHDTVLLRAAVLAGGTGFILRPRGWLARVRGLFAPRLSDEPAAGAELVRRMRRRSRTRLSEK